MFHLTSEACCDATHIQFVKALIFVALAILGLVGLSLGKIHNAQEIICFAPLAT